MEIPFTEFQQNKDIKLEKNPKIKQVVSNHKSYLERNSKREKTF